MASSFSGCVHNEADIASVIYSAYCCVLPQVSRRMSDTEKKEIKPSDVFVYRPSESGIKRWTDGCKWSPSRISHSFMIYRNEEMTKKCAVGTLEGERYCVVIYSQGDECIGRCASRMLGMSSHVRVHRYIKRSIHVRDVPMLGTPRPSKGTSARSSITFDYDKAMNTQFYGSYRPTFSTYGHGIESPFYQTTGHLYQGPAGLHNGSFYSPHRFYSSDPQIFAANSPREEAFFNNQQIYASPPSYPTHYRSEKFAKYMSMQNHSDKRRLSPEDIDEDTESLKKSMFGDTSGCGMYF